MGRTQSRWDCDKEYTDAKLFFGVADTFVQAGGAALTRNAAGDISYNQAASTVGVFILPLDTIMERLGLADDLQEQFGAATGVAGQTPAGVSGRPPFTGQTQLSPVLVSRPKGIKITDITLVYQIAGAALTLHTCRIDKAIFANNVANAISAILASAANGLATAIQANPYVTKVPVNTIFNVSDNSELVVEVAATTQAAGTYRFYGCIVHCSYNLN